MTFRRRTLALAVLPVLVAVAAPAGAQTAVDVIVGNGGGTRTLYVEDLVGNELTELDFGATRTLPFRVRVVDETMDRDDFTVSATMTNLYRNTGPGLSWDDVIDSANLSLTNPANPLGIASVTAEVQPVLDTVTTIASGATCSLLGLGLLGGCTIELTGLTGTVQSIESTINVADLSNLPLVPQGAEAGAFTNPDYVGDALDDPNMPASPSPTSRRLLAGSAITDAGFLTDLTTEVQTVVDGLDLEDVVDPSVFVAAVSDELNLPLIDDVLIDEILASPTVVTVANLVADNVLSQTGTYVSLPVLNVDVPDDATKGTYLGTLVVTGIEP